MSNDPAQLALEAEENLQKADELLESWGSYTHTATDFLTMVAENSGEDVLIQAALDANTQQRNLLLKARRHRRINARLVAKQNRILWKAAIEGGRLERKVWPGFGQNLLDPAHIIDIK